MESIFDVSQNLTDVTEENLENSLLDPTTFNLVKLGNPSYRVGGAIALNNTVNTDLPKLDLFSDDNIAITGFTANNSNLFSGQIDSPKTALLQGINGSVNNLLPVKYGVINALEKVDNLLGDFVDSSELNTDINLAFGGQANLVKAKDLIKAWTTDDLNGLPQIEVRPEADIAEGQGAFAQATNTIYLGENFVRSHLGNTEKIAGVIVEEFGHFLDSQINGIETPGDEGEIFADLVQGNFLTADQFLAKQREDDWAIAFLNGERVGIEQKVQSDTLDFFAGSINSWNDNLGKEAKVTLIDEKIPEQALEKKAETPLLTYDFAAQSSLKSELFATPGNYGETKFLYPIDLKIDLPNNLRLNESQDIKFGNLNVSSASFSPINEGSKGFELINGGFKFALTLDKAKFKNLEIKNPFGEPFKLDGIIDAGDQLGKVEANYDIATFLAGQFQGDLFGGKFSAKYPEIESIDSTNLSTNTQQLPTIVAKGKSENAINLGFDLDKVILSRIPAYTLWQKSLEKFGIGLEGLGFSIEYPNSLSLKSAEQEAKEDVDSARVVLKILQTPEALQEVGRREVVRRNIDEELQTTKKLRNKIQLDGDILDIQANLGLGFQQEFKFEPENVQVTVSVDKGLVDKESIEIGAKTGKEITESELNSFRITAPSEGCGVIKVKVKYELFGNVKNNIGTILQGSIDSKALQLGGNITLAGSKVFQEQFGPLFSGKFPKGGWDISPEWTLIGSEPDPIPFLPNDPTLEFRKIQPVKLSELHKTGIELDDNNPQLEATHNLIIEKEYEIPYNMPVSIEDATIQEGNAGTQEMIFKVTRRELSDQPLTLEYTSDKGNGSVTIEAGQAGADIKIPIPGDEAVEDDEEFTVTLKDPQNQIFAKCKDSDGNPMDKIEATGTVIDDDFPEPPLPEPGPRDQGDPHLITTDGKSYDFQGAGEFNLLESNTGDLKIQARKEPINNDPLTNVSVNTAVATILGGKRVGIYPEGSHLLIDGNPVEINDSSYLSVADGKIYREGNTYTITYPSGDKLQVDVIDDERLDIAIYLKDERQGQIRGLLGNFNNNPDDEIAKRDGTVFTEPIALEQLYGEFSDSWRVAPNESLFDYKPGEDTNTFTLTNYPRKKVKLSDLNPADLEKAYELIGDRINEIDPNLREGAIIDFVLSGFKESYIESAIKAGSVKVGSVVILDELGARDDFAFTNANLPIKLDILSNDTVNPNTPIAIASFDQISTGGGNITQDNNSTPEDPSDDQLFYTPPINFTGTDRFKYTIFDGTQPSTAIVSINIPNLNLATLPNNQGVVIKSTTPGNFTGVAVNQISDINGDQIADIATGAFAADPNGNNAAGETYVLFGTNQPIPNNIDPNTLNGTNGFTIKGMDNSGFSGGSLASAGDINKDGIDDIVIGAFGATVNGQNNAGKAYVIYGNRNPFPASIDVSTLNGANGFALTGLSEFSYAGVSVGTAGDFNRDGIDDLFINAPGPLNSQASKTYVLLGSATGFPPSINLGQPNNVNTITIDGLYTKSGGSVSAAGDVNKDGISDLIIGADTGGKDSYIVYGSANPPNTIYLYSPTNNNSTISGIDINPENGTNVSGIGDVNQDGIDDVIVSATSDNTDGTGSISKAYVIFGQAGNLPTNIDVKTLNGSNGFSITSTNIDSSSNMAVSGKGDFNKDGIADIILGKPNDNANVGNSYVIFGSKQPFPANIDVANLNGTDGLAILGTETDDLTGVSVASGSDVNKDTIDDIVIGAPGNLFNDSPGKSYVVYGDHNFGNSTSLVFDESYYLANNPEVNSAIASGQARNALDHFSKYGINEGRNFQVFLFNEKYYLQQNPDVNDLIAQGVVKSGLEHFTKFGQFEGRKATPANETTAQIKFDEKYYLTQNPEVKELIEQGVVNSGFEHFLTYGQYEGRKPAA